MRGAAAPAYALLVLHAREERQSACGWCKTENNYFTALYACRDAFLACAPEKNALNETTSSVATFTPHTMPFLCTNPATGRTDPSRHEDATILFAPRKAVPTRVCDSRKA